MKKLLALSFAILLSACGSSPQRTASDSSLDEKLNDAVMYAMSLTDTPYRYGGNSPDEGFDCSGFVGHVYQHSLGITLPRTSREISQIGISLHSNQLRPGDLVFFNTRRRSFSHVGIYVGDGKFVHAPKSGSTIRVENLNEGYWANHYNGARRIRS
jgi:cell wall-associated NlpC family hydrolase